MEEVSVIEQPKPKIYKDCSDFIAKQRQMLEDEHREEQLEHDFIIGQSTCGDLEELGLAVNKLKLKSVKIGLYGRTLATFAHPHYSSKALTNPEMAKMLKLPESKFSAGDNVGIFKQALTFNSSPLEKGVIFKKTNYKFVIAMDNEESENNLSNQVISLVMEVNEVTYKRYKNCLDNIATSSIDPDFKGRQIFKVLFEGSDPNELNPCLKQSHVLQKPISQFHKKDLNEEQKDAINFSLSSQTISLIHGPPGTGKTMTVCELIYQAVEMGLRVLACAGSNIAVDNIVERLAKTNLNVMRIGHPARMLPSVYEQCLDNKLRKTTCFKELKKLKQNINKQLINLQKDISYGQKKEIKKLLTELRKEIREQENLSIKEVVQETQVVCCTNSGAADHIFKKEFKNVEFDLVIIDECAQALELSCWIPIMRAKRVVLAGDHKQLPPTIKSRNAGLSITLFDRVLQEFKEEDVSRLLKVQYRMNKQIMEWSSQYVYGGHLRAHESVADHNIGSESILLFIDTAGAKMGESISEGQNDKSKSKSNLGEADLIRLIFDEIQLQGVKAKDIGVITPYNAQVDLLRKMFTGRSEAGDENELEVSTVDGFQGREKDCILISMVRSNPLKQVGFLSDYRRMNVAVTRARKFVCLIGDSETVSSDEFLKQMVTYFQEHGEVRSAMEYVGMEDVHFNIGCIDDKAKKILLKTGQPEGIEETKKQKDKQKKQKKDQDDKKKDDPSKQKLPHQNIKFGDEEKEKKPKFSEEDLKQQYTEDITQFLLGKNQELKYSQINSFQRRVLHELAEKFKLDHESIGTEAIKDMILKKTKENKMETEEVEESKEPEVEVTSTKSKKKKNKNKGAGGILIGSSLPQEEKKEEIKKKEESKDISVVKVEPPKVKEELNEQQIQLQEYAKKKQQEAAQKEKLQNEQREALEKEKREKKQEKKNKKKPQGKQEQQEESQEEILAYLAQVAESQKTCSYYSELNKKCIANVQVLGYDCDHCGHRYCSRHGIPEEHGCGDIAKKEAKEKFSKDFMMQHRGEKPLRKDQIENLQSKLQNKIKENIDSRKAKQPEKKTEKK